MATPSYYGIGGSQPIPDATAVPPYSGTEGQPPPPQGGPVTLPWLRDGAPSAELAQLQAKVAAMRDAPLAPGCYVPAAGVKR